MHSPFKAAFQPPSDMGTTSSGGSASKIWKVLGIGCGLIVLIIGIGLAFGLYKGATFCGSGIGMVKSTMNAQKYGGTFATHISKGEFEEAYGEMTPRLQQELSQKDFIAMISKYKDKINATPVARGFQANNNNTMKIDKFELSFFFPVNEGTQMPTIDFTVVPKGEDGGATVDSFQVDTFEIFLAERTMDNELPAQMVMRFGDHISKGQNTVAYMSMGESFRNATNQEAFEQFLKDAGTTFTKGRWEIQDIKYHSDSSATVMAISRGRTGKSMLIQFEMLKVEQMGFPMWQIEAIAPLVAGDQASDAKVEDAPKNENAKEIPKLDKAEEAPKKK